MNDVRVKPSKPYPSFPLGAASNGQWRKKIGGKTHYFGTWENPDAALDSYLAFINDEPESPTVSPAKVSDKAIKRPAKPYAGFPLFPHSNGQWAKKVRGRIHYFGVWPDHKAALDLWLATKDELLAGRTPRATRDGLTISGLMNRFFTEAEERVKQEDLKARTFDDYKLIGDVILATFGPRRLVEDLGPEDFQKLRNKFAETHGPVTLRNDITRARVIFNYADETFRIRVHYGSSFKRPGTLLLRRERNKKEGSKFYEAGEVLALIEASSIQLRAMIYLGINCGFGNHDCATIERRHLNLDRGWHTYPRPKTEVIRRFPLWPETVQALREALAARPLPRDPDLEDRVFITARGNSWDKAKMDNPITKELTKVLKTLGLQRPGRNFYSLRHTFATVGEDSGEPIAVKYAMGHAPESDDMASVYREKVFEQRLMKVSNHVRRWLQAARVVSQAG